MIIEAKPLSSFIWAPDFSFKIILPSTHYKMSTTLILFNISFKSKLIKIPNEALFSLPQPFQGEAKSLMCVVSPIMSSSPIFLCSNSDTVLNIQHGYL